MKIIETYIVYYPKRSRFVKLHKTSSSTGKGGYYLEVDATIYSITIDEAEELLENK